MVEGEDKDIVSSLAQELAEVVTAEVAASQS